MQHLRSLAFNAAMYAWLVIVGLAYAPWALVSERGARRAIRRYVGDVLAMLPRLTGLRPEVRGTPPTGQVLVAGKHHSFLDVLMAYDALPNGIFIMKSIFRFAPFWGLYVLKTGFVPVQRGRRSEAIRKMLAEVRAGARRRPQLIIYPQGTRVAPDATRPYKVGTFALYEQLGQPCVPFATNVGMFWPKRGLLRRPGTAVVEFLEPIPPGLDRATFMAVLEARIEGGSNRLLREAGFPEGRLPPAPPEPALPAA